MAEDHPVRVDDRLYLRLFDVRRLPIDTFWAAQNVRSTFWRMYVNNRDGAELVLPRGSYRLAPGEVHFVPAWVPFSCRCSGPVSHFYVHFEMLGLPAVVVREVFDRPCSIGAEPEVLAWSAGIRDALPDELAALARAKSQVYLAFGRLFESLTPEAQRRCRQFLAGDEAVRPALQQIEEHFDEGLDNASLARLCSLSEDHFIRRFRETVGQTPAQYVLDRRVTEAAQLLLFGADSIDRIATRCGFPNRHYFSRVFKQRIGQPPAAYRRSSRV